MREAAEALSPRRAVVVVVWKRGIGLEAVVVPEFTGDLPPADLDVRTAAEFDDAMSERARRLAERGASVACEAGFEAEGLAVADVVDGRVAETLLDVAGPGGAPAMVLGPPRHASLGATTRDVIRHSTCPVLVCHGARA